MDNSSQDPQKLTQQIAASYVDDYMPPVAQPAISPVSQPMSQPMSQPVMNPVMPQPPISVMPPMPPAMPSLMKVEEVLPPMVEEPAVVPTVIMPAETIPENPDPMADFASTPDAAPISAEPVVQEPVVTPPPMPPSVRMDEPTTKMPAVEPDSKSASKASEALEDQNIFEMLGISSATEAEKESFLDELQQIIWEDFLDNDVELLLTEEELADFKKISEKDGVSEDDKQTEMVDFLEKLVPDLEKIMLEKAIELKEEMFTERLVQLRKQFAEKPEALDKLDEAKQLQQDQKWRQAAQAVNAIAQ